MRRLLDTATAILNARPALGWDGLAPHDAFTGAPIKPPAWRGELGAELEQQVTDALVFLAGWKDAEGEVRTLAAFASGMFGREVAPGAFIIAAEIAGIWVDERLGDRVRVRVSRHATSKRQLPPAKYRGSDLI